MYKNTNEKKFFLKRGWWLARLHCCASKFRDVYVVCVWLVFLIILSILRLVLWIFVFVFLLLYNKKWSPIKSKLNNVGENELVSQKKKKKMSISIVEGGYGFVFVIRTCSWRWRCADDAKDKIITCNNWTTVGFVHFLLVSVLALVVVRYLRSSAIFWLYRRMMDI